MFTFLIEWAKNQAIEHGLWFLFVFSFTESVIQPIPVEPVLLALSLVHTGSPLTLILVSTLSSILGASFGYFLGKKYGHPAFLFVFRKHGKKWMESGEKFFEKWGIWAVFLCAFTPIPFKAAAWLSGIFEMKFLPFVAMAIFGRTLRFGMVVYGIDLFLSA
ncbi:DedA family protein [Candidatus Peregrinibacteria bacterium]|nr:DedA family protein [Candidatus Peregrinibacteria bacterium]